MREQSNVPQLQSLSIDGSDWSGPTELELEAVLTTATYLQGIHLKNCSRLTALPDCITRLQGLTVLELAACRALKQRPEYLPEALQVLSLRDCSRLTALPPSIGEQAHLRSLDLLGCPLLIDISGSLTQCVSLKTVTFGNNRKLKQAVGQQLLVDCNGHTGDRLMPYLKKLGERLSRHRAVIKLSSDQLHMTQSLERLSWLAVMLATATFVGFLQPPFGTIQQDNSDVDKGMPNANRIFFCWTRGRSSCLCLPW